MIRALFLDLDGTLIDRVALWQRCLAAFLAERGLALREAAGFPEALRSPFLDWSAMVRILERSTPGIGLDRGVIARALRGRMVQAAAPDPAANAVLDALATRYKTAIVTNGSVLLQRAKIVGAELTGRMEAEFISGRMRVRKPDPEFFARVLAWANVDPSETLLVGDHPRDDIFGAQRAGL